MTRFLQSKFNGNELAELEKLWHEDIANEEAKSQAKWQSKQEWLENYEQQFNNKDLIKQKSDAKPTNSSHRRQRNARDNKKHNTTTGRHHVSAQSESSTRRTIPRSANRQTTNKERSPPQQSNQRHDTQNTRNPPPSSHQPNQRNETQNTRSPTSPPSYQLSQHNETENTRNPTAYSHQSGQYYDSPNAGNEHTVQNQTNRTTISLSYSDVIRQSHFKQNPPPQFQQPMFSSTRGPHFLGMRHYHLNEPPLMQQQ